MTDTRTSERKQGRNHVRVVAKFGSWLVRGKLGYVRRYFVLRPSFDNDAYLAANRDVAAAGLHPLLHYVEYGAREGRPLTRGATTDRMNDATSPNSEGAAESRQTSMEVDAIAPSLSRLVQQKYTATEFRRFESHGVHVMPVHFYNPIPDVSQLSDEIWSRPSELVGIDMNDAEQLRLLREVFPQFREEYEAIPTAPTEDPAEFHLNNGLFDGTDALVLYCMLRHLRPRRVIEIGSGYSSRLAARAARANGSTDLVCIEPYPDEVLRAGFAGLTSLIPSKVEDVPLDLFTELEASDVLFIDSSHVVRIGSDVTYLFLEVLPRLRPGVAVHVHDIFLPFEYPRDWVTGELRFWTEQYLLHAFLAFNSAFRVLFANSYANARYPTELRETFPSAPWWGGGSFWMQRRTE